MIFIFKLSQNVEKGVEEKNNIGKPLRYFDGIYKSICFNSLEFNFN